MRIEQATPAYAEMGNLFRGFWRTKDDPLIKFYMPVIFQGMSFMIHKPARFFSRGRLLNLFFGSSQTDHWMSKYGHVKFGGAGVFPI